MYEEIARNKRRTVSYIVVFVVLWLGVGALIGGLAAVTVNRRPGSAAPIVTDVFIGVAVATVLVVATAVFIFRSGTRLVLSIAGAQVVDPKEYAQLCDLVQALALGTGLPSPAVYVIEDTSPNAFATGISPDHAAVIVTTGLLAVMDREQLEGVLGHELSHIKSYDIRLLLIVTTLLGMAGLAASLVWRSAFFMRGRGRNGQQLLLVVLAAGGATGRHRVRGGPDHPPGAVAAARVARRCQQRRTHPQPRWPDPRTEDTTNQRRATEKAQPRDRSHVHR